MKLILILFIIFSVINSFGRTDPEGVGDLTLEAPKNIESKNVSEKANDTSDANTKSNKQKAATTEEILAKQGFGKENAEEKTAREIIEDKRESADLGELTGVEKYKITCVLNDDTREITAIETEDGTLGIRYTKFGSSKTVAIAKSNPDYVNQVAEKIYNNLANGQYPYSCTRTEASN